MNQSPLDRMALTHHLNTLVGGSLSLEEICRHFSQEIRNLVSYDRLAVNLLHGDQKYVKIYSEESALPSPAIPEGFSPKEGTATGWVIDHKQPLICADLALEQRLLLTHQRYKNVGLRSYIILPLIAKGQVLGALNLGSLTPGQYDTKDIAVLTPVAEILSVAIENANLYHEAKSREKIQKILNELSQDITTLDIDSLLKKLIEKVREVMNVDVCDVRVFTQSSWQVVAISGLAPGQVWLESPGHGSGRARWIAANRKPLAIPDLAQHPDFGAGRNLSRLGLRGYLGVPLFSRGGEVAGELRALTHQPRAFTQDEIDLLQQLANGAAVALENARLFQEARRREEIQTLLKELSQDITSMDLDALLKKLTDKVREILKADVSDVRVFEGGRWSLMGVSGLDSERVPSSRRGTASGRSSWIIQNRRPLVIPDATQEQTLLMGDTVTALGLRGYLAVPLFARKGEVIGILRALTFKPRQFTQEEVDLLQQLGNGAAAALENARLFEEVQKKSAELEEAFRTKSAFLNTMAHEMKTPLHVITGIHQLMVEGAYGGITEEQKKWLERAERYINDLLSLIDEILQLARLETRRVPLHIEEFSAKEIIDELESSFMPLAKGKGLELEVQLQDSTLRLKSDKSKIKVILENLLSNAVKYSDEGKIDLCVNCLHDNEVSFFVRDTGIGIRKDDIKSIFEPFYMAEGVDRKKRPGSGLGLTIVKKLAELLKGDIRVESEWGKGSTFTVTVPVTHPNEI